MTRLKFALHVLGLLLALAGSASGDQQAADAYMQQVFLVQACVIQVRHDNPGSQFDAYVDAENTRHVHTFGSTRDDFLFDKCMAKAGHKFREIKEEDTAHDRVPR